MGEKKVRRPKPERAVELVQSMRLRDMREFARLLREQDLVAFSALHGYIEHESNVSDLAEQLSAASAAQAGVAGALTATEVLIGDPAAGTPEKACDGFRPGRYLTVCAACGAHKDTHVVS